MSEEKIEKSEQTTPKAPAKRKIKGKNRFARWFREMRSELKKVVWPTPKQILNNTIVSLSVMAAAASAVWALDHAAGQIFQAIRTLAGR
jgi:preprotein translocase subunit SecE